MAECDLCPRGCGANRDNSVGYCGARTIPHVARAALHHWEEPCISGTRGSGTVFFCGCNLNCVFCQNHEINHALVGTSLDANGLSRYMLALEAQGAHNINLVSPMPHVDIIIRAVEIARDEGLALPIVYNTNAYEKAAVIERLEPVVDIYLPDLKYVSERIAERYSGAADYFHYAKDAILEMHRQKGTLLVDGEGLASRGVLIRHLVLPGSVDETRYVLDFIAAHLSLDTHISLMGQYVPTHRADFAPLNRKLMRREYDRAIAYCLSIGFANVYTQDLSSATMAYRPQWSES